jgi:hypothetical protein
MAHIGYIEIIKDIFQSRAVNTISFVDREWLALTTLV